MTPFKTSKGEYLAVEVPKGAQYVEIVPHIRDIQALKYIERGIVFAPTKYIELPPGTYTILGIGRELTEEQLGPIMGHVEHITYVHSFYCLMFKHGISPDELILKKIAHG